MCARVKASRISRLELLARVVGEHSENNKVFNYSLVLYLIYFFSSIFTHTFCLFIPFVFIYFFILYFDFFVSVLLANDFVKMPRFMYIGSFSHHQQPSLQLNFPFSPFTRSKIYLTLSAIESHFVPVRSTIDCGNWLSLPFALLMEIFKKENKERKIVYINRPICAHLLLLLQII